jgi:hypothetical protein
MMAIKSGGGLNQPGEAPNNPVKQTPGRELYIVSLCHEQRRQTLLTGAP